MGVLGERALVGYETAQSFPVVEREGGSRQTQRKCHIGAGYLVLKRIARKGEDNLKEDANDLHVRGVLAGLTQGS